VGIEPGHLLSEERVEEGEAKEELVFFEGIESEMKQS